MKFAGFIRSLSAHTFDSSFLEKNRIKSSAFESHHKVKPEPSKSKWNYKWFSRHWLWFNCMKVRFSFCADRIQYTRCLQISNRIVIIICCMLIWTRLCWLIAVDYYFSYYVGNNLINRFRWNMKKIDNIIHKI